MSDYAESDLSSLESDDDEINEGKNAKGKGKGKGKGKPTGYVISNALNIPRATTYSADSLNEQIHGGDISLDADYQRDVVWSDAKQIHLIDSILRNFYIPPVIFALATDEEGGEKRTCIDGKQRLTSICKFMSGEIPHKDSETSVKYWYKQCGDPKRKLLPERMRKAFSHKQIVCVEYAHVTDEDEREIFQRVQMGVALTPAEKMGTVTGPRADFAKAMLKQYVSEDTLGGSKQLKWDISRGSDFRSVVHICYTLDPTVKSVSGSYGMILKWLENPTPPPSSFKTLVEKAMATFLRIVKDSKLNGPFKQKVSPAEFVYIATLCGRMAKKDFDDKSISEGIKKLRKDVRDKHTDVRMNNQVINTLLASIAESEGGVPKRKREQVEETMPPSPPTKQPRKSTITLPGRARPAEPSSSHTPPSSSYPTPAPNYPSMASNYSTMVLSHSTMVPNYSTMVPNYPTSAPNYAVATGYMSTVPPAGYAPERESDYRPAGSYDSRSRDEYGGSSNSRRR